VRAPNGLDAHQTRHFSTFHVSFFFDSGVLSGAWEVSLHEPFDIVFTTRFELMVDVDGFMSTLSVASYQVKNDRGYHNQSNDRKRLRDSDHCGEGCLIPCV
jgi:hypothetical protein